MTVSLKRLTAPFSILLLGLAACQQSGSGGVSGAVETALFAPTPYAGRSIPSTYGTPYACSTFKQTHASGWKGIIGGRKYDFDNSYIVSGAGCFPTRQECEAYLTGMSPYVDFQSYRKCEAF